MAVDTEESVQKEQPQMVNMKPDWMLQQVVEYANRFNMETSITLQTSGMLVSGTIINGAKYFQQTAESFAAALSRNEGFQEASEKARALFGSYKELYEYPEDRTIERSPPTFIHLANVRFVVPGNTALKVGEESLWRGRISEVAGFTFSTFG